MLQLFSFHRISHQTQLRLLLLPYSLGIITLVVIPAGLAFAIAFFHYNALSAPRWAGTLNFILAYTNELFNLSIQNSLALIILPVPMRIIGTILLARLLQRGGRFLIWFRAAVYLPGVIPGAAYALGWLWVLNPLYGPLNLLLRAVGFDPPAWFVEPQWVKPAIVLMSLWQIGEGFLVSLATLQELPKELEDAAKIDGASSLAIFWHVTLPLVAPILLLLAFRDAIITFQESFTTIYLITGGGPYYASYTLPFFIYEQGFDQLFFGVASAALWVMYGLSGLIVVMVYIIARQWNIQTTDETLAF